MRKNRIRALSAMLFVVVIFMVVAITFMGIFAALYIKEKNENDKLSGDLAEANRQVNDTLEEKLELEEAVTAFNEIQLQQQYEETGDEYDLEKAGEEALKSHIKELVTAEDGSPLKMLREIFPENLIYYDDDEYVFAPVLEEVQKHSLLSENFVKNENGEMQYVEDGEVISHKGIDVSKYQGTIDWDKVRDDDVEYAFVRLGIRGYESGKIVIDENFDENMRGAYDAGIATGVYFFTQAVSVEEAVEEAEFVIENISEYDVQYPVVIDVEAIGNSKGRADTISREDRTEAVISFCETIRQAGYTPMIYGNVKCFTKMLDLTRLEDYEKWYAFYDDYMYIPYNVSCWQYSDKGTVSGIKGKVDLNISYKTW
jgi:GH25 family lysozyme M1 (1,4-beta-N-acetylmuramidase)/Na+-transporting methylmalonyl-CoA/oxaloacetate decarboxylase gamma subunit